MGMFARAPYSSGAMASEDRIPDKLGPYRLQERLGEGGMGAVYLARDREKRPVAVKVLHSRVAAEPTARRRLAREVEAMRRVQSPYVAEVLDADVEGKFPYIVTRYVPGQTLDHSVREHGPLSPAALERLARGLAQALVAVHAAGVVHRDLKPGNVMLRGGDPVVIDFGIAYTGADSTRLTQTGMFMGTPGYLAPEVIEGQPSSEASDIHSWGATLAFAATGRPPFGSGSFENVFYRIVQGHADIDGIPAPLAQLVAAALSRDPRRRPTASWLCQQSGAPGLAAGPPMLTGAAQAATMAPGHGAAPGAAAVSGAVNGAPANGVPVSGARSAASPAPRPPTARCWPRGPKSAAWPRGRPEHRRPHRAPRTWPGPARCRNQPGPSGSGPATTPMCCRPSSTSRPAHPRPRARAPTDPVPTGRASTGPAPDTRPSRARTPPPGPMRPAPPMVATRAQPLPFMGLALIVAAVALAVLLPVAGTIISLAVITLLRAADRSSSALSVRRSARGPSVTDVLVGVLTAPWSIVRSLLTTVLVAPLAVVVAAVVFVGTMVATSANSTLMASGYAAGAAVALYGLGPGSAGPRREVTRLVRAVARDRTSAVVAALVMYCLAAAMVAEALSQPPVYWPNISSWLPHLPNVNTMLHLPHLNLPHFGVGRSRLG